MDSSQFLVVLGIDANKVAHAARFNLIDEAAVRKAAKIRSFKIGVAKTKDAAEAAGKLIEGKIFDSGRGSVPVVAKEKYDQLLKLLELREAAEPALPVVAASKAPPVQSGDLWKAIKVGSAVLAKDPDPGPERGYWPVIVTEVIGKAGDALIVRYKDYPKLPPFRVKRNAIALLPK